MCGNKLMAWGFSTILEEFKQDYYDPTDPIDRMVYEENQRKQNFSFGIVTDNQDPDKRGRIKVHLPMIAKNYISKWIWIFRPYGGDNKGIWALPDIGDQVMIAFIRGDIHHPVCIGGMYTPRHRPPIKDNPDNNIKAIKTKACYLLMDETPGEERMEASIKDGQIRVMIDTKGVHLTNELGGIDIQCRKLAIAGGASTIQTEKDLSIKTGGNLNMEAKSNLAISAGGDITIKGSTVDLKGSTGVTAEGKQIAKENDPVAGMDMHDIEVPTNSGTKKVPAVRHPYLGKLVDKLSGDVTIGGKAAATQGSKSEFGAPGHFPMLPGIKFSSNPDNMGEVTGGCIDSVKINGNPAAVMGSSVTTCDDAGQSDQCKVLAPGTVVTFPIQYPGQDPEQYKRDGGLPINVSNPTVYTAAEAAYATEPKSLTALQWSASEVNKGEEVTLSCSTSGVKDGAGVMFSIYPEGADTEVDPPLMDIRGENKGSRAEVKWIAKDIRKADGDQPMKWFFTAWTLYCPKETSGMIRVVQPYKHKFVNKQNEPLANRNYTLRYSSGNTLQGTTDGDGYIEIDDLHPGKFKIEIEVAE